MKIEVLRSITRAVSLLAVAFIFSAAVFAQSNTGSITGVVTDPNGAVVPNSTVTVTNQGTNEKRTVQSDGEGRFEVLSLPTGMLTLSASSSVIGEYVDHLSELAVVVGDPARAMGRQAEIDAVPDACELGMMIDLLGVHGDASQESEGFGKILELEGAD